MGELVPFPTRDRGRILVHRDGTGDGWLIDHEEPAGGSYGLEARAETLEGAKIAAVIASRRRGDLLVEVRP
ncbi:hypothetical protein [Sphingosinicella soli]|uniref:Uncharacterized protein n=1 Tax=Sphingosinicella soli TaxID=333708 RepID=A0A7W7B4G7_9SPHN|nr:hypothetical protein [Sphingosinicella soli]MBB4633775.1 hypothetical protein [Sphingosinicella soli]